MDKRWSSKSFCVGDAGTIFNAIYSLELCVVVLIKKIHGVSFTLCMLFSCRKHWDWEWIFDQKILADSLHLKSIEFAREVEKEKIFKIAFIIQKWYTEHALSLKSASQINCQ